eukprot:19392-Eustigmatos_ZCMA.PRE.1
MLAQRAAIRQQHSVTSCLSTLGELCQIAGVREQLGKINKALPVAFWSDPSLDIKEIVESWAVEAEAEGMDYE